MGDGAECWWQIDSPAHGLAFAGFLETRRGVPPWPMASLQVIREGCLEGAGSMVTEGLCFAPCSVALAYLINLSKGAEERWGQVAAPLPC